jgi:hypothetical protein
MLLAFASSAIATMLQMFLEANGVAGSIVDTGKNNNYCRFQRSDIRTKTYE